MRNLNLIIIFLSLLVPITLTGQTKLNTDDISPASRPVSIADTIPKKDCEIKDISDVSKELFSKMKRKKKKKEPKEEPKKDKVPRADKKVNNLILPVIASNPATGFQLGVGASSALYLGPKENTRVSFAGVKLAVTTKEQFISYIKSNLYTAENKFFFSGDWRYYIFSEDTYGLGTNSPEGISLDQGFSFQGTSVEEDENDEGIYPMRYNYFKFHEIANIKVFDNFYLGLGYQLDAYENIEDLKLNLDSVPRQVTPHFSYSKLHGFNPKSYTMSGFSFNAMFDSRDNQINAYNGYYVNLNYRVNPTFLGSNQNSSQLWTEFRTYVGLSKKTPSHLIAFWYFGNFLVSGEQPYLTLMSLGNDQRLKSGRGYTAGRFRGEDYMYVEAEYRFPILRCAQTLGGVVFANASTASNRGRNVHLFDYVRPAIGFGFRLLMNKYSRMNITIDFAYGFDSKGTYFGGTETF